MKKVFLSLAVIAALTVVSCKQKEAEAAPAVDSTAVDTTTAAAAIDTAAAAAAVDTAAAKVEDAKEAVKK